MLLLLRGRLKPCADLVSELSITFCAGVVLHLLCQGGGAWGSPELRCSLELIATYSNL